MKNSAGVAAQIAGAMLSAEPPKGFTGDAKEAWTAAVKNAPPGSLLATDVSVLERWCRNYALYRKVAKSLEHGDVVTPDDKGNLKVSAEFVVMQALDSALLKLEKELGFTPCARARVRPQGGSESVWRGRSMRPRARAPAGSRDRREKPVH